MQNNRFDFHDKRTERIWRLAITIVLIPVALAIISSIFKIINQ